MKQLLVVFYTIIYKELHRILRLWLQTILPPIINMTLYFFIFGQFVGQHIGAVGNFSYAQFITPGLIILSTVINAYMNSSSSVFLDKFQGCLQEIISAPVPEWCLVLAVTLGSVLRGIIIGLLIALIGWLCVGSTINYLGSFLLILFISNSLFAILGFLNALYANHFDGINFVPSFIITPLTFLGGVFYPVDRLPVIWQDISCYNPFVYLVQAMRASYTDGIISLWLILSVLFLSLVAGVWATLKLTHRSGILMR